MTKEVLDGYTNDTAKLALRQLFGLVDAADYRLFIETQNIQTTRSVTEITAKSLD